MKLIFMCHGSATKKKQTDSSMDDFRRELTREGVIEVKEMIESLPFIFKKVTTMYCSPLVRTIQTSQILSSYIKHSELELMPSMDFESDLAEFQKDLKRLVDGVYCFIGHGAHLSVSINMLLNNREESRILIRKGGVVVVEGKDLHSLKLSSVFSPQVILKLNHY